MSLMPVNECNFIVEIQRERERERLHLFFIYSFFYYYYLSYNKASEPMIRMSVKTHAIVS